MNAITITRTETPEQGTRFHAKAARGGQQAIGRTRGEALDAIASQLNLAEEVLLLRRRETVRASRSLVLNTQGNFAVGFEQKDKVGVEVTFERIHGLCRPEAHSLMWNGTNRGIYSAVSEAIVAQRKNFGLCGTL